MIIDPPSVFSPVEEWEEFRKAMAALDHPDAKTWVEEADCVIAEKSGK